MPLLTISSNQPPERFYKGGSQIRSFRRIAGTATHEPEDWLASTATIFGEDTLGLSKLEDGTLLKDVFEEDPSHYFGAEHVAKFGSNPLLLTKLLDAGQRLPVHYHPNDDFACEHLGSPHGKNEAWYMLNDAEVYLGFKRDMSSDEVGNLVSEQDSSALLACLNRVEVNRGDTVYVPAGLPHAIGSGAFLVEVQEPTDQSILMEWRDFDIKESQRFLGLDIATALGSVNRAGLSDRNLRSLISSRSVSARREALVPRATRYFRIEEHNASSDSAIAPGYQVLVVVQGKARISAQRTDVEVHQGHTLVVPHAAQATWQGRSEYFWAISCRPPHPTKW